MKLVKLIIFFIILIFSSTLKAQAIEFKLLVLPTDIFTVCENYFCFPEVSDIVAENTIENFYAYKDIKVYNLSQVRDILNKNVILKEKTKKVLSQYAENEKVDFSALNDIAEAFDVKSVLLITSYAINDKVSMRRGLWDILEISSAFQIAYPFELKTSAILTDCVNNVIMWSGKYTKDVSNADGYYSALNQSQAMAQLEKIKLYSKYNISQNISQNVFMRFFPREVRTFYIKNGETKNVESTFRPNALENLSTPRMNHFFNDDSDNFNYSIDDFSF